MLRPPRTSSNRPAGSNMALDQPRPLIENAPAIVPAPAGLCIPYKVEHAFASRKTPMTISASTTHSTRISCFPPAEAE